MKLNFTFINFKFGLLLHTMHLTLRRLVIWYLSEKVNEVAEDRWKNRRG